MDAPATPEQKKRLSKLSAQQVHSTTLAGEKIEQILTNAPPTARRSAECEVSAANGWFAARPSGNREHLQDLRRELQGHRAPESDPGRSTNHRERRIGSLEIR